MKTANTSSTVVIIGGGVVGTAIAFTLAHRGVSVTVLEAQPDLALAASGTNSGILHTGFDSAPGELETDLILRAARMRPAVMEALDIPVLKAGAVLVPHTESDHETIAGLAANASANGVEASIRESDGALEVPGEWVTDPVAYTRALAASAIAAGADFVTSTEISDISRTSDRIEASAADGRTYEASFIVNAAGLHADEIARAAGDSSFSVYPRKGEFFVFDAPSETTLKQILLPVPTKRTKGVLVFPTIDGKVVAGPTAHDQSDKNDWTVRPDSRNEVLDKAYTQFPELEGVAPSASYAGLRPAGRDCNYVIGVSVANDHLVNVGAIRSTGLSASLGIGEYVTEILSDAGVELGDSKDPAKGDLKPDEGPWWRRTARFHGLSSAGDEGLTS